MRTAILALSIASSAASWALWPTPAAAQPAQGTAARITGPANDALRANNKPSFVAMPIPLSDPAIGTGLAVAGMALYNQGADGRPWTTGVGALYTDNTSWAAAAFHKSSFADDRYRLTVAGGYADLKVDFYGIGADAGSNGVSIGLNEKGVAGIAEFLVRVAPNLYLGARYRGATVDSSLNRSALDLPDLGLDFDVDIPEIVVETAVSSLGLAVEHDTRDSEYAPRKGTYFTGDWLQADENLGSDFEYARLNVALNGYHGLGENTVIAWRGSACFSGDGAPFYDLCNFGSSNDLRGYPFGQFRDHAMYAVQAEVRQHLFWRFGGVAFAGVGEVASDFADLTADNLLPAAGVGLRFEASRKYRVNLSIDYAVGDDTEGLYFYVGEAF